MKEKSYIHIESFMVTELNLKGNELLIYAIIFGFSQDGKSLFSGSLQYLCEWTNSTKQGVAKNLKNLLEKKLIAKKEVYKNGVKYCLYSVTDKENVSNNDEGVCNKVERYTTKFNGGMQQSLMGYTTKFNGGVQQSLPNTINDTLYIQYLNTDKENDEYTRCIQDVYKVDTQVRLGKDSIVKDNIRDTETINYADVEAVILNDGTEWKPTEEMYQEYVRLFPNIDIKNEFRKIRSWCLSNNTKRKTLKGVNRFINGWLSRATENSKPKENTTSFKNGIIGYVQSDEERAYMRQLLKEIKEDGKQNTN